MPHMFSSDHIDLLVSLAAQHEVSIDTPTPVGLTTTMSGKQATEITPTELGRELLRANARAVAVQHRYDLDKLDRDANRAAVRAYEFTPVDVSGEDIAGLPTHLAAVTALWSFFAYQAQADPHGWGEGYEPYEWTLATLTAVVNAASASNPGVRHWHRPSTH